MKVIEIERRVDNFKSFYKMENTRPLMGFFWGDEYPLRRYPASKALPSDRSLTPEDFNVDSYLDDYEFLFDQHEACGGDSIFSASGFWGIPWLEAIMGCEIFADHSTASISAHAPNCLPIDISFDPYNPWVVKMGEFIEKIAARSAGRYPIGTTRMRGVSDLLAALFGVEFIYKMIEESDETKRLSQQLTDLFIDFGQYQLERIPPFHGGIGSFYYHLWAPKNTIWLQEDSSALLSPDLYGEFIQQCDQRIVDAFGSCIIHQHPVEYLPTKAYMEMGMTALELHIDSGGPSAEQLFDRHIEILSSRPLIIWGRMSKHDLDWIFSRLPASGLAVIAAVDTTSEAQEVYNTYVK